jgi:hypothetical protein
MPRISVFGFYAVERWGVQQSEIVITCRFTQPDESRAARAVDCARRQEGNTPASFYRVEKHLETTWPVTCFLRMFDHWSCKLPCHSGRLGRLAFSSVSWSHQSPWQRGSARQWLPAIWKFRRLMPLFRPSFPWTEKRRQMLPRQRKV